MVGLTLVMVLRAGEVSGVEPAPRPYSELAAARSRLLEDRPSIGGWIAGLCSGFSVSIAGGAVAIAFLFGGTGDVSAMAFFLIGLPGGVALLALGFAIVATTQLARALARREEIDLELEPLEREMSFPGAGDRERPRPGWRVARF